MKFNRQSILKSKVGYLNQHIFTDKKPKINIPAEYFKKKSIEKEWLDLNLTYWCNFNSLTLYTEYLFATNGRKWRSDYFINIYGIKVLIEYEGVFAEKSRHTTAKGYSADSEKYNHASSEEFIVLRYTALTYKKVLRDLDNILSGVTTNL